MFRINDLFGVIRPAALAVAGLALTAVAVSAFAAGPAGPTSARADTPAAPSAPVPAAPASAAPGSADPTEAPTEAPSEAPSDEPGRDAMPIAVELETSDGHAVSVDVVDHTGWISGAVSGRPGDGASVEGYTLHVANVDARTLRLTWIDFAMDNQLALFVDDVDGQIRLALVQPGPTGPTDAIGADRVLDLTFDRAVDAASVEAILQEGLDTPG
jgi:hypothetical protein